MTNKRSIFNKYARSLYVGRLLLNRQLFDNKRIIVVGPARTLEQDLLEFNIDDFDIVVKMNAGIDLPLPQKTHNAWRCDVLFHSFSHEIPRITKATVIRTGVKTIVYRTPTDRYIYRAFRQRIKFLFIGIRCSLKIICPKNYKRLRRQLGGYSPTTGLVCIDFLLGCKFDKLAIVGFTFFTTKYMDGYNDAVISDTESAARVRNQDHHNPDGERKLLAELLHEQQNHGRLIHLGSNVEIALFQKPDEIV
jgi:hypothetical protein